MVGFNLVEWAAENISALLPVVMIHQWERGVKCRNGKVIGPARKHGIKFYVPFWESYDKIDMQEQTVNLLTQTMQTSDGRDATFSCNLKFRVFSAIKKFTVVHDFEASLLNEVMMVVADVVNHSTWGRLTSDKNSVEQEIKARLNKTVRGWGAKIMGFGFTDLVIAKPYRFFGDPLSK